MFFLFAFIIAITFIKIKICVIKEKTVIVEIKIFDEKIFIKDINLKNKQNKSNMPKINFVFKIIKCLENNKKKYSLRDSKISIYISNSNYIIGSYYFALGYYLLNIIKNISDKIEIICKYKEQKNMINFNFKIVFNIRIYNLLIILIKILIIFMKEKRKERCKNG